MVVEYRFKFAVDNRQRIFQRGRAGRKTIPLRVLIALDPSPPIEAGEGLRDMLLVDGKHVDAEAAIPFNHRPGDDPRLRLTITEGCSAEREETDVAVKPVLSSRSPTVMTLTAPARWRMDSLNAD